MADGPSSDVKLEIGHVLFIDLVHYSKLLIDEQSERMQKLRGIQVTAAAPTVEVCQLLQEVKKGQAHAILHCTC